MRERRLYKPGTLRRYVKNEIAKDSSEEELKDYKRHGCSSINQSTTADGRVTIGDQLEARFGPIVVFEGSAVIWMRGFQRRQPTILDVARIVDESAA